MVQIQYKQLPFRFFFCVGFEFIVLFGNNFIVCFDSVLYRVL